METDTINIPGMVALEGVTGSRAYGLDTPESDVDLKGVYVAPTRAILSIFPIQDTINRTAPDVTYHEVGKFISLALAANPTIMEMLFLEDYTKIGVDGDLLVRNRHAFLSQRVKSSYGEYAMQQATRAQKRYETLSKLHGREVVERVRQELIEARRQRTDLQDMSSGPTQDGLLGEHREEQGSGSAPHEGQTLQLARSSGDETTRSGVRSDARTARQSSDSTELHVRDLSERLSGSGGSQSRYGPSPGASVPTVQSGAGTLPRQPGTSDDGSELSQQLARIQKHMRHCFRLLQQGQQLLRTGSLTVRVPDREGLFAIAEASSDELVARFEKENEKFLSATESSILKPEPDYKMADNILQMIRERHYVGYRQSSR